MSELKPCPFCGEPVVFNKFAEKVVCEDCGATIYSDYWNTRPIEDDLRKRIAELEALVERLIELGDVINGDKDSVWTLQTIKECWTEDVTKWKERE